MAPITKHILFTLKLTSQQFVVTAHLVGTMRGCRQCSQVAVCFQVGSKLDRPAATEEATTTEAPAEGADGWEA